MEIVPGPAAIILLIYALLAFHAGYVSEIAARKFKISDDLFSFIALIILTAAASAALFSFAVQ